MPHTTLHGKEAEQAAKDFADAWSEKRHSLSVAACSRASVRARGKAKAAPKTKIACWSPDARGSPLAGASERIDLEGLLEWHMGGSLRSI